MGGRGQVLGNSHKEAALIGRPHFIEEALLSALGGLCPLLLVTSQRTVVTVFGPDNCWALFVNCGLSVQCLDVLRLLLLLQARVLKEQCPLRVGAVVVWLRELSWNGLGQRVFSKLFRQVFGHTAHL